MSLRARLLTLFGLIIVGLTAVGVYTEHKLDSINGKKVTLKEEWQELGKVLQLQADLRDAMIALESGERPEALRELDAFTQLLQELRAYQGTQRSDSAPAYNATEIQYLDSLSREVSALQTQIVSGATVGEVRQRRLTAEATLEQFVTTSKHEMVGAIDGISDTEGLLDTLLIVWACALVAALAIALAVFHGSVTRPLRALREGALARRARRFDHRVAVRRHDEIGDVAEAFNAMSAELHDLYGSLEDKVAAQAEAIQRSLASLERSQRLAGLGTLAAGVAHEINNPLGAIAIRAEGMSRRAHEDDLRGGLDLIQAEVARCREITQRLLDFARQRRDSAGPDLSQRVDLGALLRDTAKLASLHRHGGPPIALDLPPSGPTVEGDPTGLRQVFLNLLLNAVEAAEGSPIHVSLRSDGGRVTIEVTDAGQGIDPDDLPHVFDPFFTTKRGAGTGLGLSVSHGIIADHGGTIELTSEGPGRGATARVTLPVNLGGTDGHRQGPRITPAAAHSAH
jgi:signal transduction histidine kinase